MRTYTPKPGEVTRTWHVIDATDVVLGRLASQAAVLLRGKHKPQFAPHVDTGDFVIIVNADKVALTGAKLEQKKAYRHSGFPGGLRSTSYTELLAKSPTALRIAKQSFNADSDHIHGIGGLGFSAVELYYQSAEAKEGKQAFLEKRNPDFRKHAK